MHGFRELIMSLVILCATACAQSQHTTAPATQPGGKLPHVQVDPKARQVRVECQMLGVSVPLEFFCVLGGTNEHESALRTEARPSHIHLGLLMLGIEPGEPVRYSDATKKWQAPHGPPLDISIEFLRDGKPTRIPAARLIRSIKTRESMPQHPFIFAGSRQAPDGTYAADVTGYVVSIVNFDLSLIDVPELASNSNETLEWEINKDIAPAPGTAVTMIIEPINASVPTTQSGDAGMPAQPARIAADQQRIARLRERWQAAVAPHQQELRDAAQAHYDVITQLRREQQRLIDEADQIQRLIDELERHYQQMTTPQPAQQPDSK